MNEMVDRIRMLCKKHGMSLASLEKELGFANGSLAKSDEKIQSVRIKAIADYFGVSIEYLLTGKAELMKYYFDIAVAERAQELFENPDMRILFDAAKDSRPEDLQMAANLLSRLKETNPDG